MRRLQLAALALAFGLAGCGGGAEPSEPAEPGSDAPATTQKQDGEDDGNGDDGY